MEGPSVINKRKPVKRYFVYHGKKVSGKQNRGKTLVLLENRSYVYIYTISVAIL